MSSPIHFYLTFNPFLNNKNEAGYTQAHEFFELLEEQVKKDPENGHAYWGKIIGKDRVSKIDFSKFEQVVNHNNEAGHTTHLYISDFTNLWVAKIDSVVKEITKKSPTLDFYEDKNVEIWFKVTDFTLLEYTAEDTASKLSELYIDNDYMDLEIQGLSPFTTGIRYPAFIQDIAEEAFFDEIDKDECSHLVLKYKDAVFNTAAQSVLKTIHAFAFPENMYMKFPHAAKAEIESAELDIVENRHHHRVRNAFSYIKALELILNDLTIGHLKRSGFGDQFFVDNESVPPKLQIEEVKDGLIPISKFKKNFSINQLLFLMRKSSTSNHFGFKKAFANQKQFVNYVCKDFAKAIEDNNLLTLRSVIAHNDTKSISEKDAIAVRNLILGMGCRGLIHSLYQTFYPDEFKNLTNVLGDYKSSAGYTKQKPGKKAA